jgi:NADPH:quinone reductase-like Zn-dependent oxidoreductase
MQMKHSISLILWVLQVDWKTRRGDVPQFLVKFPKILGGDVAGIVVESDSGSRFTPGTAVFSCTDGFLVGWLGKCIRACCICSRY